ncbi:MAG: hypothetical protein CMK74_15095 [Pseudomonadales bacterium]|nr:hypothetical protein [Pseudomonadales bacterium]
MNRKHINTNTDAPKFNPSAPKFQMRATNWRAAVRWLIHRNKRTVPREAPEHGLYTHYKYQGHIHRAVDRLTALGLRDSYVCMLLLASDYQLLTQGTPLRLEAKRYAVAFGAPSRTKTANKTMVALRKGWQCQQY